MSLCEKTKMVSKTSTLARTLVQYSKIIDGLTIHQVFPSYTDIPFWGFKHTCSVIIVIVWYLPESIH